MMRQTEYHSYCKINLGLEILRKRPDGYHDLNTLFYRLSAPYDLITVAESEKFDCICSDPILPTDSSNLIVKAIERCAEFKNLPMPGLKISLTKEVPFGAGLGGGSADAATAIAIFSEWVAPLTEQEQFEIARGIGADVSFFLLKFRAASASSIGDMLMPLELHVPYPILIIKPIDISISTAKAYQKVIVEPRSRPTDLAAVLSTAPLNQWKNTIVNDFEIVAFQMAPALEKLKSELYETGAEFALMSGSGSAFFGVFLTLEAATRAKEIFSAKEGLEVFISI